MNPGDSGGPVVNDRGELVAIVQSYMSEARNISNFVDISEVRAVLSFYERSRGSEHSFRAQY